VVHTACCGSTIGSDCIDDNDDDSDGNKAVSVP